MASGKGASLIVQTPVCTMRDYSVSLGYYLVPGAADTARMVESRMMSMTVRVHAGTQFPGTLAAEFC